MHFSLLLSVVPLASFSVAAVLQPRQNASTSIVNQTTCNGQTYTYNSFAGYGFIPSDMTDKYGDTLGGFGSSIAIDQTSWKKTGQYTYAGTLYAIPDRGWNTLGTLNYQNRIHKIAMTLTLKPHATVANPSPPNLNLKYLDTTLLTGPDGTPVTGLDAQVVGPWLQYPGFPILPTATYQGDGFGGNGSTHRRISIDSEGLVLGAGGTYWVSDEYGPYIYHFSSSGRMIQAIMPNAATIPRRNNTISFSADSPPIYDLDEVINPANTATGRDNNQGLEGLTVSSDGKRLYAMMQSALDQEGGPNNPYRRPARLLEYDISNPFETKYVHEYVVVLPLYPSGKKVAAQSEIHYISDTQFLVLARDSNSGHGQSSSTSVYRHADVFDISQATDIKSAIYDAPAGAIANADGVVFANVTPAEYCSWLDYNVNSQLGKFGLHNGGAQDNLLLNEKWESLALVPVNPDKATHTGGWGWGIWNFIKGILGGGQKPAPKSSDNEYFLFSLSDNDFITQDGHMNFGRFPYKDASGYNLDNQALVFQVTLPNAVGS